MTLTEKMELFLASEEKRGVDISRTSNDKLLLGYYKHTGTNTGLQLVVYLHRVSKKLIPAYSSVTRAIRKARELNPKWRKAPTTKATHVAVTKEEVGY